MELTCPLVELGYTLGGDAGPWSRSKCCDDMLNRGHPLICHAKDVEEFKPEVFGLGVSATGVDLAFVKHHRNGLILFKRRGWGLGLRLFSVLLKPRKKGGSGRTE